jgi:hypothetical protein
MPLPLMPSVTSTPDTPRSATKQDDSGYGSPDFFTPPPHKDTPTSTPRPVCGKLPERATRLMEAWYREHFDDPYPPAHVVQAFAKEGGLTTTQVKKWFANKRVRTTNTLSFNGALHPRRLHRLMQRRAARHSPLDCSSSRASSPSTTAIDRLNAWYAAHRLHPMPSNADLVQLSASTGLTQEQVMRWLMLRWSRDTALPHY